MSETFRYQFGREVRDMFGASKFFGAAIAVIRPEFVSG